MPDCTAAELLFEGWQKSHFQFCLNLEINDFAVLSGSNSLTLSVSRDAFPFSYVKWALFSLFPMLALGPSTHIDLTEWLCDPPSQIKPLKWLHENALGSRPKLICPDRHNAFFILCVLAYTSPHACSKGHCDGDGLFNVLVKQCFKVKWLRRAVVLQWFRQM